MDRYDIMTAYSQRALVGAVNHQMERGWRLVGGVETHFKQPWRDEWGELVPSNDIIWGQALVLPSDVPWPERKAETELDLPIGVNAATGEVVYQSALTVIDDQGLNIAGPAIDIRLIE